MPRVVLRKEVPDDLAAIHSYLAERHVAAAERFLAAAKQSMQELAEWPRMGSPKRFASRRLSGVRSWQIKGFRNYLILYHPIHDGIRVLAVLHGARQIRTTLRKRQ